MLDGINLSPNMPAKSKIYIYRAETSLLLLILGRGNVATSLYWFLVVWVLKVVLKVIVSMDLKRKKIHGHVTGHSSVYSLSQCKV